MAQKRPNLWPQTESVWRQQSAGKSKVRFHLQSHSLLQASYHALPSPKPQPIASRRGREHATIHQVFCKGHCFHPGRLGNGRVAVPRCTFILFYLAFMSILATWLAIWFSAEFGYSSPLCGHSLATFPIVKKKQTKHKWQINIPAQTFNLFAPFWLIPFWYQWASEQDGRVSDLASKSLNFLPLFVMFFSFFS